MADSNHAMDAYKVWQPAAEKFDYHIATVAAAVSAWGVQTMTLTGLNMSTGLQAVGLALLCGSTYFALRRIEGSVQIYRMSLADATNTDRYSKLIEQERINHAMGEPADLAKIAQYEDGLKAGKTKAREYANTVKRDYRRRNRLLLSGLVVYAVGRGWAQVTVPAAPQAMTSPTVQEPLQFQLLLRRAVQLLPLLRREDLRATVGRSWSIAPGA
ncbi:hypothetical protein [Burkholderia sp. LMU1-1-1.1]|uniref:hypothetical protein n=1 Tax=Burkholderia sp. LMU1-1-1.1 TaxID=3135266 RepID=UPI0034126B80